MNHGTNPGVPDPILEVRGLHASIAGKPILLHTVEAIAALDEVRQIIVALPEEHIAAATAILEGQPIKAEIRCVAGGASRQVYASAAGAGGS